MNFTPDPAAYGIHMGRGEKEQEKVGEKRKIPPSNTEAATEKPSKASKKTNNDSPKEKETITEEESNARLDWRKKLALLKRKNPQIKFKTYADFETQFEGLSSQTLKEYYENACIDLQSTNGAPAAETVIYAVTYPFSFSLPEFCELCQKDEPLNRDIELEICSTLLFLTPRINILFRFFNNFVAALKLHAVRMYSAQNTKPTEPPTEKATQEDYASKTEIPIARENQKKTQVVDESSDSEEDLC